MDFAPHGEFEISRKGEVFIIRFIQSWNLEGAVAFFEEYQSVVLRQNLTQFGVVSDLRQFNGGTPDAIAFFRKISQWAKENGQIARAQIVDSGLKAYTIDQIDQGNILFEVNTFCNETDALSWMADQGLVV